MPSDGVTFKTVNEKFIFNNSFYKICTQKAQTNDLIIL